MVEPVLPGARGPGKVEESGAAPLPAAAGETPRASEPAPLFGAGRKGQAPFAVLSVSAILPPEILQQVATREDGPRLAPLLAGLFPAAPGREDDFGADALRAARQLQERAAELTADVARRDLHGRVGRLAERLMDHAAPGWADRVRRAFGGGQPLDGAKVRADILAIQRELSIVMAPTERLAHESAPVVEDLALCCAALQMAQPWLDQTAAARRQRLLEAAHNGCGMVPTQARHLALQLEELLERLRTVENATLPALLNADAARRLGEAADE